MNKFVTSKVRLNIPKIKQLDRATITSLEKTIDALYTEVVQAQVMPFDTGNMQNDSTFPDYSDSKKGKVSFFILNIIFKQQKMLMQGEIGMNLG